MASDRVRLLFAGVACVVGQDALAMDLEDLLHNWNASGDETVVVPSDYLEVVAVRR